MGDRVLRQLENMAGTVRGGFRDAGRARLDSARLGLESAKLGYAISKDKEASQFREKYEKPIRQLQLNQAQRQEEEAVRQEKWWNDTYSLPDVIGKAKVSPSMAVRYLPKVIKEHEQILKASYDPKTKVFHRNGVPVTRREASQFGERLVLASMIHYDLEERLKDMAVSGTPQQQEKAKALLANKAGLAERQHAILTNIKTQYSRMLPQETLAGLDRRIALTEEKIKHHRKGEMTPAQRARHKAEMASTGARTEAERARAEHYRTLDTIAKEKAGMTRADNIPVSPKMFVKDEEGNVGWTDRSGEWHIVQGLKDIPTTTDRAGNKKAISPDDLVKVGKQVGWIDSENNFNVVPGLTEVPTSKKPAPKSGKRPQTISPKKLIKLGDGRVGYIRDDGENPTFVHVPGMADLPGAKLKRNTSPVSSSSFVKVGDEVGWVDRSNVFHVVEGMNELPKKDLTRKDKANLRKAAIEEYNKIYTDPLKGGLKPNASDREDYIKAYMNQVLPPEQTAVQNPRVLGNPQKDMPSGDQVQDFINRHLGRTSSPNPEAPPAYGSPTLRGRIPKTR